MIYTKEFQVYYDCLYIGRLVINEKGQHLYSVHDTFKNKNFLRGNPIRKILLTEQLEFGKPIEFFNAIITAQKLFGGIDTGVAKDVRLKRV